MFDRVPITSLFTNIESRTQGVKKGYHLQLFIQIYEKSNDKWAWTIMVIFPEVTYAGSEGLFKVAV